MEELISDTSKKYFCCKEKFNHRGCTVSQGGWQQKEVQRRIETFTTETDENVLSTSMGQYINYFSAFHWPYLVVEWLGLLSMFNCVNVSAWAIHNVNYYQCICWASSPCVLLLCESIFAWTI